MSRDFLLSMARHSQERAQAARSGMPLDELRRRALATAPPAQIALSDQGFDAIAEIKLASPAEGELVAAADSIDGQIAARAASYAHAGAAAVSVLTEPSRFHGSLKQLQVAADALRDLGVPVMRKDFLIDPYQVVEARASGAGGVLLILRMLDDENLATMLDVATEMSLFVLLEGFDSYDLQRASRFLRDGVLLGVNCRDLRTLKIDPARFATLIEHCSPQAACVAESGLTRASQAGELATQGYRLALVGTALMRAADPGGFLEELLASGRAAARRSE